MTDDGDKQESPVSKSTSSYIYPVRTLLTGIQAATTAQSSSRPSMGHPRKSNSAGDLTALQDLLSLQLGKARRSPMDEYPPTLKHSSSEAESSTKGSKSILPPALTIKSRKNTAQDREHRKRNRLSIDNFRDFRPEDDPFEPRTFVSVPQTISPRLSTHIEDYTTGPMGELVPYHRQSRDAEDDYFVSPQLDTVAAEAFREPTPNFNLPPRFSPTVTPLPSSAPSSHVSNISQSGIVHLPPAGSTGSSLKGSDRGSRGSGRASAKQRFSAHSTGSSDRRRANSIKSGLREGESNFSSPFPASSGEPSNSALGGTSEAGQSQGSYEPLVTVRYQHAQDVNGNHIVIGREGHISRCEDEPIRTPGAVQGFGVLVAVAEDAEAETLVVRQVSENAQELLGLSPKYLFSLECLTDTFSDSQSEILWDNVQFLNHSSSSLEEQGDSPHVFMISGYGEPGTDDLSKDPLKRREWTCWCAAHRPTAPEGQPLSPLVILEFELERDVLNPLYPHTPHVLSGVSSPDSGSNSSGATLVIPRSPGNEAEGVDGATAVTEFDPMTLDGREEWMPSPEEILESTTSRAKPLTALERLRRISRGPATDPSDAGGNSKRRNGKRKGTGGGVGMMDVFAVMAQINEQLGDAPDLAAFLKVVVGVIQDLTQFHRVLVYQFDEAWNGQVVAELLDWSKTHELYKGLHFPAGDIPAQARHLYTINKVRILYDRGKSTARLVVRSQEDLATPLDMTHCYLRAMSPIHLKYLENMEVRASMSVSIMAFGTLWGLVSCHGYGPHGMRVSFPVRQMLRLLSQSISKNIERLSYAQRLRTRKLINTMPTDQHPSGYIVSNADDLLGLFDADHGVLVIGEGAKILGPNENGQEILIVAEYLRLKQFTTAQVSQSVSADFPDLQITTGLEFIAGLLYVPLSAGGRDFIVFLRKGQPREVHWAGRPFKDGQDGKNDLEPRRSFKVWRETTTGRSRVWTDEQLETAGVLALVYGKFIEVWRQKENAMQATKLTNILLSNASHEVRTPLNHIINYLELALNGPLDGETRENLSESHAASKSLLFTINDLLDLTRLESGQDTSFNEPFDLHRTIEEAITIYRNEADRRQLGFDFKVSGPKMVVGDSRKIRTVVANLTANALKYSTKGTITVECRAFGEPEGLRDSKSVAVEIIIADNGCGISSSKLESIFREFEQVESTAPKSDGLPGLGLGLAVVARIVEQLGGQLRVDSKINVGSRFSFLIPFMLHVDAGGSASPASSTSSQLVYRSRNSSGSEIDSLVSALQGTHMTGALPSPKFSPGVNGEGRFDVEGSNHPIRPVRVDGLNMDISLTKRSTRSSVIETESTPIPVAIQESRPRKRKPPIEGGLQPSLNILIVEDNEINSKLLGKRLTLDGHVIKHAKNGQEGLDILCQDREFDCVLMDIQMPLLDGYQATARIRELEKESPRLPRISHELNDRIPIFAVSASLLEDKREEIANFGMDGWILKPIDFKRLRTIMLGITDVDQRLRDVYYKGRSWEAGGWLRAPPGHRSHTSPLVR